MEVLRVAPISNDVKYEFDDENYDYEGECAGYNTLDNGLTYLS